MVKVKIDFKSFIQKGIEEIKDDFFIRLINGYQGTGKTYLAIKLVEEDKTEFGRTIKTNIKSYHSSSHEVIYFDSIDDIINDVDDNITYVIDEISKRYSKQCKQDERFYSFLQQSRKHSRHVYLITQEYIQVPQWLRGVANTVYTTSKVFLLPIYKTSLGVPFLNDDLEWTIEPYLFYYYKRTKKIADSYNTLESINSL